MRGQPGAVGRYKIWATEPLFEVGGVACFEAGLQVGGHRSGTLISRWPALDTDEEESFAVAKRLRRFRHTGLSEIVEVGRDGAHFFVAQGCPQGASLWRVNEVARREGLCMPVPAALHIALCVLEVLEHLQEQDALPDVPFDLRQIWLSKQGAVSIVGAVVLGRGTRLSKSLRVSAHIRGLGVILWRALTGRQDEMPAPVGRWDETRADARSIHGEFDTLMEGQVGPSALQAGIPTEIDQVIVGCAAAGTSEGLSSFRALRAAVEELLDWLDVEADRERKTGCRLLGKFVGALVDAGPPTAGDAESLQSESLMSAIARDPRRTSTLTVAWVTTATVVLGLVLGWRLFGR